MNAKKNKTIKTKTKKILDLTEEEIGKITPDEIQRLFYDLQVHQVELEMQNEELEKTQFKLTQLNNRLNLTYHQVPIGILTLNHTGFIEQANMTFVNMLKTDAEKINKMHFSKFIKEEDKNIFIQRFNAFFKHPDGKSMQLSLVNLEGREFPVLIKGKADDGSDFVTGDEPMEDRKLVIVVTDLSDVLKS